jgi:hypothetical protein
MNKGDPKTKARLQITLTGLIWAGLSAACFLYFHYPTRGWIFGGLSALFLVSAAVLPPLAVGIHKVLSTLTHGLVTGISLLCLIVVFYLVLLPAGLVLRATRSLKTTRRPDPALQSYWTDRPKEELTAAQYLRPF